MQSMALKLFRSTGYSSLLIPGETRLPAHPSWLVLGASLWLGIVCNVGVWRLLGGTAPDARNVLASVLVLAGANGLFLNLLGWRRTIRLAITLALLVGVLVACGLWSQQLPIETLWHGPSRFVLPGWASLLRWQVLLLILLLGVVPIVWVWNHSPRRLSGAAQLRANLGGAAVSAVVFLAGLLATR
jgi:glucan phosphoethanolaminetransferase (alkaline phosphatase superfamily)